MANTLKSMIEKKFVGQDMVCGLTRDVGITGNFEVTVDGKLVHSKVTKSQGFPRSEEKRNAIFLEIAAALKGPTTKE